MVSVGICEEERNGMGDIVGKSESDGEAEGFSVGVKVGGYVLQYAASNASHIP